VRKQSIKHLAFILLWSSLAMGATTPQAWRLTDKFKTVSVGEWVRLRYSGGSEHLLLVARKNDETVTLEERVREEGYLTSWTQTVIGLKKGLPTLFREKTAEGELREIKLEEDKVQLDEDFQALLAAEFWQEPGTERVVVPAGTFTCQVYRAVYNKKLIRVFLSKEIPLYPVKVLIPNYQLTISLTAYGKGMESRFFPEGESPPAENSGGTGSKGDSHGSPESS
jgi:hypothetical protein